MSVGANLQIRPQADPFDSPQSKLKIAYLLRGELPVRFAGAGVGAVARSAGTAVEPGAGTATGAGISAAVNRGTCESAMATA